MKKKIIEKSSVHGIMPIKIHMVHVFLYLFLFWTSQFPLQWRHNGHDGVSHHQPYYCLLNCLIRWRSKKTSKGRITGLCVGNSLVNSPHKGPVTRFPFDDIIMFPISFRFNCIFYRSYIIILSGLLLFYYPHFSRLFHCHLGQSYDCPSASEVSLECMGKYIIGTHQ